MRTWFCTTVRSWPWTVTSLPYAVTQAVAIRDGLILAVGEDDRILQMAGPNTVRVNLDGKAVIPGVVDTHSHPNSYAVSHYNSEVAPAYVKFLEENQVRFPKIRWEAKETALSDLKRVAEGTPPGYWIYSRTFGNPVVMEQITRYDLDAGGPQQSPLRHDWKCHPGTL